MKSSMFSINVVAMLSCPNLGGNERGLWLAVGAALWIIATSGVIPEGRPAAVHRNLVLFKLHQGFLLFLVLVH
jgi:hypothetical protein